MSATRFSYAAARCGLCFPGKRPQISEPFEVLSSHISHYLASGLEPNTCHVCRGIIQHYTAETLFAPATSAHLWLRTDGMRRCTILAMYWLEICELIIRTRPAKDPAKAILPSIAAKGLMPGGGAGGRDHVFFGENAPWDPLNQRIPWCIFTKEHVVLTTGSIWTHWFVAISRSV